MTRKKTLAKYQSPKQPARQQPITIDGYNLFQRIIGEVLVMGSHPGGLLKGMEARADEVARARLTTEAEQILAHLVNILDEDWNTGASSVQRILHAIEKAEEYLKKRGIDYSTE